MREAIPRLVEYCNTIKEYKMPQVIEGDLFDITADPIEINKRLKSKQLCFLLNQNLKASQTAKLIEKYYLMGIEHDGEVRHGVVCGLYKQEPADYEKITSDTESAKAWMDGGNNPVLSELIEEPLCIVVSESLDGVQMSMLERVYEVLDITHDGRRRKAIACAYYDPNIELKGEIVSQEWRLN